LGLRSGRAKWFGEKKKVQVQTLGVEHCFEQAWGTISLFSYQAQEAYDTMVLMFFRPLYDLEEITGLELLSLLCLFLALKAGF